VAVAQIMDQFSRLESRAGGGLILVGGVPGAGKSTAIRAATADLDTVTVLDPEDLTAEIRGRLPGSVSYRVYRSLVHTTHTLRVVWRLLRGPGTGPLVVHDPGTRRRRRRLFVRLARSRGWRTTLLWIDVDRHAARKGQIVRGRALQPSSFDRHWARWERLRATLPPALESVDIDGAENVILVDRDSAATVLRQLCVSRFAD
jgi:predicted kinase